MNLINFKLEKNKEIVINENKVNCIKQNDKITFVIDGIKYIHDNNIFIKETSDDKVSFDFNKNICTITLKAQKLNLNLKIDVIENKKIDNIISIKYKIETEEDILNIITIEYV